MSAGFDWPLRVYWEDTDAGGVVFYANYLKFFERGRTEWLRSLGFDQEVWRARGCGMFVVSRVEVDYRASARLDDRLRVNTRLLACGRASVRIAQSVWRTGDPDMLLCHGTIRAGWVDAQGRPGRFPQPLQEALA
ncbi:MAG: tol-pal system-associated acyl-CoA thioesterase [Rhodoferax sp.]